MKIACYIGSLGSGGIESCTISQYLKISSRVQFYFIVDRYSAITNQHYLNLIEENSGKVVYLCDDRVKNINKAGIICKIKNLIRICNRESFDVIHIHASYPSNFLYGVIARICTKSRIFSTIHAKGAASNSKLFRIEQLVCRYLFPRFIHKRIAVSNDAGKWGYGKCSFNVLTNGVDLERYKFNDCYRKTIRQQYGLAPDTLVCGIIGRLEKDKNHSFAFRIFKELLSKQGNSILLVVGEGSLRNNLECECNELNISNSVIFTGYTNCPEEYFSALDILLFPSLREGFGLVAIEAQACQLPVIASEAIPLETKVSDYISYLPLQDNYAQWVEEILRLTNSKVRPILSNEIIAKYSLSNISNKLVDEYH